ncbi:hypothetical protein EIN_178720 [Entamoeba invadens IP1]|uniref:hypothetical protein n=1 Tax=Entamoeba invadens IP1 TaxID=370355 RepID=UPI0002C3F30A|nr:hypothetical protein EIN_178720 [Entamoeba invadens IP1]ELP93915.1 hypothetical protein EIN_178720 [Entamoeba invadens IP1]|eukprot:XP_004260686.1 hypothetical protein EIN_178720 [Entamoeba invadens IP1]
MQITPIDPDVFEEVVSTLKQFNDTLKVYQHDSFLQKYVNSKITKQQYQDNEHLPVLSEKRAELEKIENVILLLKSTQQVIKKTKEVLNDFVTIEERFCASSKEKFNTELDNACKALSTIHKHNPKTKTQIVDTLKLMKFVAPKKIVPTLRDREILSPTFSTELYDKEKTSARELSLSSLPVVTLKTGRTKKTSDGDSPEPTTSRTPRKYSNPVVGSLVVTGRKRSSSNGSSPLSEDILELDRFMKVLKEWAGAKSVTKVFECDTQNAFHREEWNKRVVGDTPFYTVFYTESHLFGFFFSGGVTATERYFPDTRHFAFKLQCKSGCEPTKWSLKKGKERYVLSVEGERNELLMRVGYKEHVAIGKIGELKSECVGVYENYVDMKENSLTGNECTKFKIVKLVVVSVET